MSAPGWSTDPQSRGWPELVGASPATGEFSRWASSSSQPRRARRMRSGWHAYRPSLAAALPRWAMEVTLTIEQPVGGPSDHRSAGPNALLLLRSRSSVAAMMLAITDASAEVERLAGVGRREPRLHLVRSVPEPGLEPIAPLAAHRHLRLASHRGLAAGSRRRSSAGLATTWEAGAGAVVTCHGPAGSSAQAVISLHGRGDPRSLRPSAGGALVVRAWRLERTARRHAGLNLPVPGHPQPGTAGHPGATWALASGLILASSEANGLGRAGGRLAAAIRTGRWDATVLTGTAALEVARAGDPRQPAPHTAARWVTDDEVASTLVACLAAGMST